MAAGAGRIVTAGMVSSLILAGYLWQDEGRYPEFAEQQQDADQPSAIVEAEIDTTSVALAVAQVAEPMPLGAGLDIPELSVPALASATHSAAPAAAAQPDDADQAVVRSRMSRAVQQLADGGGSNLVEVIVAYDQRRIGEAERVSRLGGEVQAEFLHLPLRAMRVPADQLAALAAGGDVRVIDVNAPVQAASVSARVTAGVPTQGSSAFWPASGDIAIAVVDSGVAPHADLSLVHSVSCLHADAAYMNRRALGNTSGICHDTRAADSYGHGTHIAGSAAGTGLLSSGKHVGVSPGAPIVSLQVLDDDGKGTTLNVVAALDWILEHRDTYNIRVVNMSLGKVVQESADVDPLVLAAEAAWDAGVVIVASAGNYGNYGGFTVVSPGNSRKVITVGSLTDNRTAGVGDDYVSTYSSTGPTSIDLVLKPDLLAPGNRFVAAATALSHLKRAVGDRNVECGVNCDRHYVEMSGTSMAAGIVSGSVAAMLSKNPSLSPATIKARLMRSSRKLAGDPIAVGAGVLNVTGAMEDAGVVTGEALSPRLGQNGDGSEVLLEDVDGAVGQRMAGRRHLGEWRRLVAGAHQRCAGRLPAGRWLGVDQRTGHHRGRRRS